MIDKEKLEAYIKEHMVDPREKKIQRLFERNNPILDFADKIVGRNRDPLISRLDPRKHPDYAKLEARLIARNEDFEDRLIYYINLKGKTHPEVYNAAGITPDCFSKIISKKTKTPRKANIIAMGFALQLNLDEMNDLLSSAGYAFTNDKSDIICKGCIEIGNCNLDDLNGVLVQWGCKPLGGRK